MSASIFTGLVSSEINFLFYSAMKYKPRLRYKDITKRRKTTFLFIIKGKYQYTFEGGNFIAEDNSLVVAPRDASYTFKILSEDAEAMQIELDILQNNTPISLQKNPFAIKFEQSVSLINIFEKIINLSVFKPSGYTFSINSQLFKLISLIIKQEEATHPIQKSKIFFALSYIDNNFTKSIKCSYLAKLCLISESQLRRLFQKEVGMSPIEYKRNLQIDYAYTLLESGNYRISEIAEFVGFNNIYEFSAAFKKKTGKAPREYIKSVF